MPKLTAGLEKEIRAHCAKFHTKFAEELLGEIDSLRAKETMWHDLALASQHEILGLKDELKQLMADKISLQLKLARKHKKS